MHNQPVPISLRRFVATSIGRHFRELVGPGMPLDAIALSKKRHLLARLLPVFVVLLVLVESMLFVVVPGYQLHWYAYLLFGMAFLLNQAHYYRLAAGLTIVVFPLTSFTTIVTTPSFTVSANVLILVLGLLLASIFVSWRGLVLLAAINSLALLLPPLLSLGTSISYSAISAPFVTNMLTAGLMLLVLYHQHEIERERQTLLHVSEKRLQLALNAAAMGTWTWDVGRDSVIWSMHVAQLFGVAGDMRPTTFASHLSFIYPEDQALFEGTIATALSDHSTTYQVVHRVRWPEGHICWIESVGHIYRDQSGQALYLTGTITDITRRWLAEAALRESEERYRVISELVSDYAFAYRVTESGAAQLEWITDAFTRITGYTRQEMQGLDQWAAYVDPADYAIAAQRRQTLLAGQADISEYRIIAKDGHTLWVRLYSRAVQEEGAQRVTRIYGAVQDITQIKRLEQQLNQAQKMEAIGRIAGGIAHDFNNLLTVIVGNAELVLADMKAEDDVRRGVEQIEQVGRRATALTRQLLAFSRQQVLEPRYFDLNSLVVDMNQLLQRLIGEDITLVYRLAPDLGWVHADPTQLEQVVMNMAVNARDAMPNGGTLLIETATVEFHDDYSSVLASRTSDRYVLLKMSDTGAGMDAATRARIFDPFFTTKAPGKGTGLGLATVHGIITQSGGHIDVVSEPDQGTTFHVYLPQVNATEPSADLPVTKSCS